MAYDTTDNRRMRRLIVYDASIPQFSPVRPHQEDFLIYTAARVAGNPPHTSVSDYLQMGVFTSAKSIQYVTVLEQGRK